MAKDTFPALYEVWKGAFYWQKGLPSTFNEVGGGGQKVAPPELNE